MAIRSKAEQPLNFKADGADVDLIRRCLAGETQAWADLYLRYRTPLYALCLSWTRDHAFAEDLVHDAFVRAFEQMWSFDQQRRFFPWIATIAKNLMHDARRQRRGWLEVAMPSESGNEVSLDSTIEAVIDSEERSRVRRAIDALPTSQRTALILSELEGLTYAQIARSVGASESAVKSLIFRARAMLRRSLRPLAGLIALRQLRQRVNSGLRRASTVSARFSLQATLLEEMAVPFAFAALALLPLPSLVTGDPGVELMAGAVPKAMTSIRSSVEGSSVASVRSRATSLGSKPSVDSAIGFGPTTPGSIAPSSGEVVLQVVAPDGEVLYQNGTGFRCGGQGADLLPETGPIRAAC